MQNQIKLDNNIRFCPWDENHHVVMKMMTILLIILDTIKKLMGGYILGSNDNDKYENIMG